MAGGDRKRRNITEDMVDGSCKKCGRPGQTKRGKNGKWSKHIDRVDGKSTYCGEYFPLTGVLEND
jgi:ssDNA-binding Zn-finger/Zn-ribbon topoisomerase 1